MAIKTSNLHDRTLRRTVYMFLFARSFSLREECRLRFLENRVLRRIFGPKRDDVIREWRRIHYENLHDLCFSYSGDQIKNNNMGEGFGTCERQGFGRDSLIKKFHLEDLHAGGRTILKWILKKYDKAAWIGLIWLRAVSGDRRL
jgi:hypothetical protein